MGLTREGLEGAKEILALSSHSAGTIAEDFPDLTGKTQALPGGVDTRALPPRRARPRRHRDAERRPRPRPRTAAPRCRTP